MLEELEMKPDVILYRTSEKDPQENILNQIVVPQIIREKILESLYNSRISGF